jgi:hypothetical protein
MKTKTSASNRPRRSRRTRSKRRRAQARAEQRNATKDESEKNVRPLTIVFEPRDTTLLSV